ncbi:MAG: ATP-binding protein [Anaerolineaceae bacterium]|nr:ATP-binding protein [Anaerolineaceae bacterium]
MPINLSSILFGLIALVYAVLIILSLGTGHRKDSGFVIFLFFAIFLLAVTIFRLLLGLHVLNSVSIQTQSRLPLYLGFIISIFLSEITTLFLHSKPIKGYWWGLTVVWLLGSIFVNENFNHILLDSIRLGPFVIPLSMIGFIVLVIGWGGFSICSIHDTWVVFRQTVQPLHRNRFLFWLASILTSMLGVILSSAIRFTIPLGETVIMFAVVMMGTIYLRHDLPDIRRIARFWLLTLISIILSIAVYTAFFFLIQSYFKLPRYNLESFAQIFLIAAILTLLLNPLIRLIQRFVSKIILQNVHDPSRLIGEYSKNISNIIDLGHLTEVISNTIVEGLNIHHAKLFLVDQDEDQYILVEEKPAETDEAPISIIISFNSPVAGYLSCEHKPLAQYDIDLLPRFKNTPAEEIAALKDLSCDVYVPISMQERWIGMLGLGTKKSSDRYFEQELSMLETLAEQTAVALENARLYEDLKIRNLDNERLNRELREANRELARLDKAKSDFISIASHELRTPLTQIIGYNDVLDDMLSNGAVNPDDGKMIIGGTKRASRRLEEIVDSMFDVSKLDMSALELDMAPCNISAIIGAAAERWNDAFGIRNQNLILADELDGLPAIYADNKRLTQVFSNLIQNAIKYTPDGGTIRVSGQCKIGTIGIGQQFIEITVADTGIGIAPDELERIFEKFYRIGDVMLHSSGDIKFKGAGPGLGLTICRGVVEAHGGRVWAESPFHNEMRLPGSKFHVLLPANSQPKYQ